jgi:hypothetical protein
LAYIEKEWGPYGCHPYQEGRKLQRKLIGDAWRRAEEGSGMLHFFGV